MEDDGPGIPEDKLDSVQEPFVRLADGKRSEQTGFGLGLSIAADIAHAHGGTLRLRNRAGGGLAAELRPPREQPSLPGIKPLRTATPSTPATHR